MTDWFNLAVWSLLGTWILVIATILLMYWQNRTAQSLNSANAVMDLRERYDAGRMRAARRHLSDKLLRQAHEDIANTDVINFFELVGTLTHRRVLDHDLVWEAFGTWVTAYYWALRHPVDLVGQLRTNFKDPLIFHEFEWLNERLTSLDRKHLLEVGAVPEPISPTDVESVLRRETQLEAV